MSAAIPQYIGSKFNNASPGQKYNYYLNIWDNHWKKQKEQKVDALKKLQTIDDQKLSQALIKRQLARLSNDKHLYAFPAKSIAPTMTGMGIEHPLENGFAFLKPYGLPYLPGASVKGVLRTAAEELALGFDQTVTDWDMLMVWILFGFDKASSFLKAGKSNHPDVLRQETDRRHSLFNKWAESLSEQSENYRFLQSKTYAKCDSPQEYITAIKKDNKHLKTIRGALEFNDVYIDCKQLDIDILTPHQAHYFQKNEPPHDSADPTPNPLLVIPPRSGFNFVIRVNDAMLPTTLKQEIAEKLQQLLEYAFNWLGFGAKTSLGYGVMKIDTQRQQQQQAQQAKAQLQAMPPERQQMHRLRQQLKAESTQKLSANCSLNDERNKLLEQALEWTAPQYCLEAYQLLKEIEKVLPWSKNRKKQTIEKMQQLKDKGT